tara:strand:+ start:1101 stop:1244 length:144 start_codon:yes stop_codon:yes gene_type:complete
MRRFKPLKGLEHSRAMTKVQKARKKRQRESLKETERKPRIKRNGNLI